MSRIVVINRCMDETESTPKPETKTERRLMATESVQTLGKGSGSGAAGRGARQSAQKRSCRPASRAVQAGQQTT